MIDDNRCHELLFTSLISDIWCLYSFICIYEVLRTHLGIGSDFTIWKYNIKFFNGSVFFFFFTF